MCAGLLRDSPEAVDNAPTGVGAKEKGRLACARLAAFKYGLEEIGGGGRA